MQVTVQHQDFDRQTGAVLGYTPVAEVDASAFTSVEEALEYAWRYTNNVDGSWSMKIGGDANDNVTVLAELPVSKRTGQQMGLRSSMMGDRFIADDVTYKVAIMGFKEVEMETL
tara:strand:+ start:20748 stop:21089 length:342 start_codon:yes stop_codon:yes gene_type:complete